MPLEKPDQQHLHAAHGYIGLGMFEEASAHTLTKCSNEISFGGHLVTTLRGDANESTD